MREPSAARSRVVPDVAPVRAIALRFLSPTQTSSRASKVERFVGDGSEFESLREYVPGLDHRAIDWKASARHRKLLVPASSAPSATTRSCSRSTPAS